MKKTAMLLTLCLLIGLLSGCGAAETKLEKPEDNVPTATPAPQAETAQPPAPTEAPATPAPTEKPADPPPAETAASEPPRNEQLETAKTFVGKTTTELFAAVGMPGESDYAPSCLGPGEDGNLYYDGFTVYTYRENGVETVRIVE